MKRPVASGHPHQGWGALLIRIGVVAGAWAVPLVMLPLGGNAFGPPKAMVLAWSSVCVLVGFVLEPARAAEILSAVRRTRVGLAAASLVAVATVSTLFAPVLRTAVLGSYPGYRGLALLLACGVIGLGGASVISAGSIARHRDEKLVALSRAGRADRGRGAARLAAGHAEAGGGRSRDLNDGQRVQPRSARGDPAAIGGERRTRRFQRIVWRAVGGVATAGGALALVWTLSRGAWIAAIAAALIALAFLILARRSSAAKGIRRAVRGQRLADCGGRRGDVAGHDRDAAGAEPGPDAARHGISDSGLAAIHVGIGGPDDLVTTARWLRT
jgi:hypothetical protein